MISKNTVNQLVDEFLTGSDYYLVDLKIGADSRIIIEIDSFNGVSLDVCAALNRFIETKFDREVEDFELEVSSAGLTEPFKVLKQYEKNRGNPVEVLTKSGQKMVGILSAVTENNFTLQIETKVLPAGSKRKITVKEDVTFEFEEIKYTKYLLIFK